MGSTASGVSRSINRFSLNQQRVEKRRGGEEDRYSVVDTWRDDQLIAGGGMPVVDPLAPEVVAAVDKAVDDHLGELTAKVASLRRIAEGEVALGEWSNDELLALGIGHGISGSLSDEQVIREAGERLAEIEGDGPDDRLEVEIRMLRGSLDALAAGSDGDPGKLAAIAACALRDSHSRVTLTDAVENRNLVSPETQS